MTTPPSRSRIRSAAAVAAALAVAVTAACASRAPQASGTPGASGTGSSSPAPTAVSPASPASVAATIAAATPASATAATAANGGDDAHRQAAIAEAHRIVASYAGPPGSSIADAEPSGLPNIQTVPSQSERSDYAVDVVGWLIVPGTPQDALTWAQAHPLTGATLGDYSRSMQNGKLGGPYADSWEFDYSQPTVPASVLSRRMLTVETATLPSGKTVMRLDGEADWLPARPATEIIPASANVVTVVASSTENPKGLTKSQTTPTTTADPMKVRQIVAWVNALPALDPRQQGMSCPSTPRTDVTMTFRNSASGPVVATLTTDPGPCSSVELTLDGKKQPPLGTFVTGDGLVPQVDALLGITTCPAFQQCG